MPITRFELVTFRVWDGRSTTELNRHICYFTIHIQITQLLLSCLMRVRKAPPFVGVLQAQEEDKTNTRVAKTQGTALHR